MNTIDTITGSTQYISQAQAAAPTAAVQDQAQARTKVNEITDAQVSAALAVDGALGTQINTYA